MKNIAIIVPTLSKGGAERVAANLSLALSRAYHVFLIVHDGREVIYPYAGELIDLKLPPAASRCGKILTLLKRIWAVRRIKKCCRIDVSISHLPQSNYVNVFSRRGEQVITYVHSAAGNRFREKLISMLSHRMICVSACVRKRIIEDYGVSARKAVTIYNFCDLEPPAARRQQTGQRLVVNMGRLSAEKGQCHLIRAMKLVIDQLGQDVKLLIVGEGEKRQTLERLAQALGIGDNVRFAGFLQEPWAELAQADVYVSSSLWEGLPMALVEAGRCGLPIISTDCDAGCREILAPDTPVDGKTDQVELAMWGVLTPVCSSGDEEDLTPTRQERYMADAIMMLLTDEGLREDYAQRARRRSEDFRSEKLLPQWDKLICR